MSGLMTLKKFQYLEVFYELLSTSKSTSVVDFFALDMCWTVYFAQKLLISMLLEPQKVAPNAKSCSKVVEHNRDRPCHTSILFRVTFYQWHSVGQLFWMDQKTHSKAQMKWRGVYNCVICINTWRVCQTRAYRFTNLSLETICHTLFLSLWGWWSITEIRRQLNSVLTYSLLTDVLL